jgi:hypothetical protein
MSRLSFSSLLVLTLCSCAQLQKMNEEQMVRQRAADEQKCTNYGYSRGSDAFADCMMSIDQRRQMAKADEARRQDQARADEQARQQAQRQSAQSQADAQTQMQIKQGEDLENQMARDAMTPPAGTNCTTTTNVTQGTNAGTSSSTTVCH